MKKVYSNLNELFRDLEKEIQESLYKDVAPVVKEKMQDHVEEDVYQKYEPKKYERTGQLKEDIVIEKTDDGVAIIPMRTDEETGNYIPTIIETGEGYTYNYGYAYEQPRPFVENTRSEILNSGIHIKKLKEGLKRKGIEVRGVKSVNN